MKILLIEDDAAQSATVAEYLETAILGCAVQQVASYADFAERAAGIRRNPPDLAIVDVMVRWSSPPPSAPFYVSPYDEDPSFVRAGMRCVERMNEWAETAQVPVLIYSVLDRAEFIQHDRKLPSHCSILRKSGDLKGLVLHIRSMFPGLKLAEDLTAWERVKSAFGATIRLSIFSIDLKRLLGKKDRGA